MGTEFREPPRGDDVVQLGLIGLGKMGGNMAERLRRGGHEVVGYDRAPDSDRQADSLEVLVAFLAAGVDDRPADMLA